MENDGRAFRIRKPHLATIVHKAIERDPNHRYATAQDLAEDLRRFLGDEPIQSRQLSAVARFRRWCRKRPAVAALTTALAILLATVAVVSGVAATRHGRLASHNAALAVPSLLPLRKQLLEAAPDFYHEFIQEERDDPRLRLELAAARYRLARIHQDLGDQAAAEAANRNAIRILESLREQQNHGREISPLLANAYFLARRYQDTGVFDDDCRGAAAGGPD